MLRFVTLRFLQSLFTLFLIISAAFFMVHLAPAPSYTYPHISLAK